MHLSSLFHPKVEVRTLGPQTRSGAEIPDFSITWLIILKKQSQHLLDQYESGICPQRGGSEPPPPSLQLILSLRQPRRWCCNITGRWSEFK